MTLRSKSLPPWQYWSAGSLTSEITATIQTIRVWPDVERVLTFPDVHLTGKTCNGAVVTTRSLLYPAAVGADIGCGMAALPLQIALGQQGELQSNLALRESILRRWQAGVPILKSRRHLEPSAQPNADELSAPALKKTAERDGRSQLGTLGRGNHFLELQIDDAGKVWLLVHSGFRAMGQAVSAHHQAASARPSKVTHSLAADSQQGRAYLQDLAWCRSYARANRLALLKQAVDLLGDLAPIDANFDELQQTDHNHVEWQDGLWVHRKGVQHLAKGEWGVIPGSMATATYHVEGRGCEEALDSCSHGAGRNLSRTQAEQTLSLRDVRRTLSQVTVDFARLPKLLDESPAVYRDIEAVLRAQRELVKRTNRLTPLLTLKGGK